MAFRYDKEKLEIQVQSKHYCLEIETTYKKGAELRTPVAGVMQGRLSESLSAETKVRLYGLAKNIETLIFNGTGRHTGLEIEGNLPIKLKQ